MAAGEAVDAAQQHSEHPSQPAAAAFSNHPHHTCALVPRPQVMITRDALDSYFWLNLLLTLLAWLPGALHAWWVVLERPSDGDDAGPLTRPFLPKGESLL